MYSRPENTLLVLSRPHRPERHLEDLQELGEFRRQRGHDAELLAEGGAHCVRVVHVNHRSDAIAMSTTSSASSSILLVGRLLSPLLELAGRLFLRVCASVCVVGLILEQRLRLFLGRPA